METTAISTMTIHLFLVRQYTSLLLVILCSNFLQGQVFFHDSPPYLEERAIDSLRLEANSLVDSLMTVDQDVQRADMFELDGKILLIPDGYFDVYEYQEHHWKNLYKGIFGEYNFVSAKYVIDDTLYVVGGEGYWTKNRAIIVFFRERGEWELLKFTEDLPMGIPYQVKKGICIAGIEGLATVDFVRGEYSRDRDESHPLVDHEEWKYVVENEGWLLCRDKTHVYLMDKENVKIYSIPGSATPFFDLKYTDFVHVTHDSVVVIRRDGKRDVFAISTSLKESVPVQMAAAENTGMMYGFAFCLLASGVFAYRYFTQRTNKGKKINLEEKYVGTTMAAILPHRGKTLDLSQLDLLFGIDGEINGDAKKYKRAQIIRELNDLYQAETGKVLIERKRGSDDGRKYDYNIIG